MATSKNIESKITHTVAKTDDGTIQINFTIPLIIVDKEKQNIIKEKAKTTEVAGFRKGKAPYSKVEESISEKDLRVQIINNLIPQAFGNAIHENKIIPAIYPRVEIIKAEANSDWELSAVTCEVPNVELGNYEEVIKGQIASKSIWTPEKGVKGKPQNRPELSQMDKEQIALESILNTTKVKIPDILVEAEVTENLSSLLEKLDKLGLSLDAYLESIKKTPTELREEYKKRAKNSLIITLALNKIADEKKIEISEKEINEAMDMSDSENNDSDVSNDERKAIISSVLKRKKALELLIN